jgi:lysozyme family protein
MSDFATSLAWVLNFEDPMHQYATVPDAPPGAFAIAGVNSAAWPKDFATINALVPEWRAGAVAQFYREEFWNQWLEQIISDDVAKRVFDASVNMGSRVAVRLLQQSAGCAVDGEWGPITVETVNASPVMLVDNFIVNRCQHYRDIVAKNPADQKYLTGWLARANA